MMKFPERLNNIYARWRLQMCLNLSRTKLAFRYVVCHSCWCSFVVGAMILAIGIVLRSNLITNANIQLVRSSGIFFIVIGTFLLLMSPSLALYEYFHRKRMVRNHRTAPNVRTTHHTYSHGDTEVPCSQSNDLPSYEDIAKNSSPISFDYINQTVFPCRLNADTLSNSSQVPSPPPYKDIVRSESLCSKSSCDPKEDLPSLPTSVATIAPSSHIEVLGKFNVELYEKANSTI